MDSLKLLWLQIKGNETLAWANNLHKRIFAWSVAIMLTLLAIAVTLNVYGAGMGNVIIAIIAYLFGVFYATKPEAVATAFAGGAVLNGLPNFSVGKLFSEGLKSLPDFELKKFAVSGYDFIRSYVKAVAHVFNIIGFTAILLAYVPLKEEPLAALLLLAVAIGFGSYSLLFASEFVWLKRINLFSLLGGLVFAVLTLVPISAWISIGFPAAWFTEGSAKKEAAVIVVGMANVRDSEIANSFKVAATAVQNGNRLSSGQVTDALVGLRQTAYRPDEQKLIKQAERVAQETSFLNVIGLRGKAPIKANPPLLDLLGTTTVSDLTPYAWYTFTVEPKAEITIENLIVGETAIQPLSGGWGKPRQGRLPYANEKYFYGVLAQSEATGNNVWYPNGSRVQANGNGELKFRLNVDNGTGAVIRLAGTALIPITLNKE